MNNLLKWKEVKTQGQWDSLLLGNGASIAICPQFQYDSLYQKIFDDLSEEVKEVFRAFNNTRDVEMILRYLWYADRINKALHIEGDKIQKVYEEIRGSLIEAVRNTHCKFSDITEGLCRVANFVKDFSTIISLNYDLTLYWMMLLANKPSVLGKNYFKDGWIDPHGPDPCRGQEFPDDWEYLREPYGDARGSTLVFYPHGNLCLSRTILNQEIKIVADYFDLITTITGCWVKGQVVPLFVSEGTTEHKMQSIGNSWYLSRVYYEVLPRLDEGLVIYGWSMSDNDDHILKAILRNPGLKRIAVSVYDKDDFDEFSARVKKKIETFSKEVRDNSFAYQETGDPPEIYFFDAESEGCWIKAEKLEGCGEEESA